LISSFFFPLGFSYCNNQLLIFFLGCYLSVSCMIIVHFLRY
jgi:hypothetical protein